MTLMKRNEIIGLLENYSTFLAANGYMEKIEEVENVLIDFDNEVLETHEQVIDAIRAIVDRKELPAEPSTSLPETTAEEVLNKTAILNGYDSWEDLEGDIRDKWKTNCALEAMQEYADLQKKHLTEEHLKTVEMLVKSVNLAHNEAINDCLDCFESVFMIEPKPDNILLIMEAFKQGFQKVQSLKK